MVQPIYAVKTDFDYNEYSANSADGSVESFEDGANEMIKATERLMGLLLLCLLAGCGTPETRFLTFQPRPAAIEAQSYDLHDPFPDEDAGPKTGTRPRIFLEPKTDTRKNLELRYINAAYGYPQRQYATWNPLVPFGPAQPQIQPNWQPPAPPGQVAATPMWQQP